MSKEKRIPTGLGKGLSALLSNVNISDAEAKPIEKQGAETFFSMVDLNLIELNPYQPRADFDPTALEDLKNSILEHGVIQPITVRRSITGYELISGERRLRAAKLADLAIIPAYILEVSTDVELLEIALVENVQRENLNPIEVANGYNRLIEECNLTQEQLAKRVGKDRSTITNFLRLLRLPDRIQESLRKREIQSGHARALLAISDIAKLIEAWKLVVEKKLSVRATETLAKDVELGRLSFDKKDKKKKALEKDSYNPDKVFIKDAESKLREAFGTKVKIFQRSADNGSFEIEYYSRDDFQRLYEILVARTEE